jgi:WD40 repeat protein
LYGQKELNKWPFGIKNSNGHPFNISYVLDFNLAPAQVGIIPEFENIMWYYGSYCDPETGDLLFFTNGLRILDGKGNILPGCDSINFGEYWISSNDANAGHPTLTQSFFIPISPDSVVLIHQQIEKPVNEESPGIDFTQFTLLVNDGNSFGCILKDEKFRTGAMKPLCMVRHGNGMDWWIIIPDKISNTISKYILSNDGVKWIEDQKIGYEISSFWENSGGLSSFNVQGDQFACYNNFKGHQLFDFDRCTGYFSKAVAIPLDTFHHNGSSLSFSPNGRYLYVPTWLAIIQYDLEAFDVPGSGDTVAVYDNFVCLPDWGPGAGFVISALGPDGKIYISSANSNNCIHVINRPNLRGKACDVRQHGIITPGITNGGMPGYINYQLGPLIGSPCDPDGG